MAVNKNRLLQLALAGLEAERRRIDTEIAEIKAALKPEPAPPKAAPAKRKRPRLTAKERKIRSDRMKKYWADRKKKEKQAAKKK